MADCRDCIHHDVCDAHGKLLLIVGEFCELEYIQKVDKWWCKHFATTADVAPRAELAREIFEEIEKIIAKEIKKCETVRLSMTEKTDMCYFEGGGNSLRQASYWIKDLKKKYTEEVK